MSIEREFDRESSEDLEGPCDIVSRMTLATCRGRGLIVGLIGVQLRSVSSGSYLPDQRRIIESYAKVRV